MSFTPPVVFDFIIILSYGLYKPKWRKNLFSLYMPSKYIHLSLIVLSNSSLVFPFKFNKLNPLIVDPLFSSQALPTLFQFDLFFPAMSSDSYIPDQESLLLSKFQIGCLPTSLPIPHDPCCVCDSLWNQIYVQTFLYAIYFFSLLQNKI